MRWSLPGPSCTALCHTGLTVSLAYSAHHGIAAKDQSSSRAGWVPLRAKPIPLSSGSSALGRQHVMAAPPREEGLATGRRHTARMDAQLPPPGRGPPFVGDPLYATALRSWPGPVSLVSFAARR